MLAALLFALHPAHTEAVAGVVGRAELICAVFYLLGMMAYMQSVTNPSKQVRSYPTAAHVRLAPSSNNIFQQRWP